MTARAGLLFLILIQVTLWVTPAHAGAGEDVELLKKEIDALREGQAAIREEVKELRALLEARQGSPRSEVRNIGVTVEGSPFLGRKDAALTLIEFYDYDCPFCARHVQQTLPQIERDYIQTGKVKYVVRDYPIESIHPDSFKKHEAARCAGEQGKFWDMRARLLGSREIGRSNDLSDDAKALGLNVSDFVHCLATGKYATAIRTDVADGGLAGVSGSPTFFVGTTEPNKPSVQVLRVIRGAQPYQSFKETIEAVLLASAGK
ncbi:MAG: thioredoxin domain-containing protein [Gammaproteobacteria bacterium]